MARVAVIDIGVEEARKTEEAQKRAEKDLERLSEKLKALTRLNAKAEDSFLAIARRIMEMSGMEIKIPIIIMDGVTDPLQRVLDTFEKTKTAWEKELSASAEIRICQEVQVSFQGMENVFSSLQESMQDLETGIGNLAAILEKYAEPKKFPEKEEEIENPELVPENPENPEKSEPETSLEELFSSAAKLVPGGERADAQSFESAKALVDEGKSFVETLKSWKEKLGKVADSDAMEMLAKFAVSDEMAELAIDLGGGNLPGNASLSAVELSNLGTASVSSIVLIGVGLMAALNDLAAAEGKEDPKEKRDLQYTAATRGGMIATGAAIGAGVGSVAGGVGAVPGMLIGAGVGSLVSLFSAGSIGKTISDLSDGTRAMEIYAEEMGQALESYNQLKGATDEQGTAIQNYEDILKEIEALKQAGQTGSEQYSALLQQQSEATQSLINNSSGLITQYDVENGKLEEKLEYLKQIKQFELKKAWGNAQTNAAAARENREEVKEKLKESNEAVDKSDKKIVALEAAASDAEEIERERRADLAELEALEKKEGYTPENAEKRREADKKFNQKVEAFNLKYEDTADVWVTTDYFGIDGGVEKYIEGKLEDAYSELEKQSGDRDATYDLLKQGYAAETSEVLDNPDFSLEEFDKKLQEKQQIEEKLAEYQEKMKQTPKEEMSGEAYQELQDETAKLQEKQKALEEETGKLKDQAKEACLKLLEINQAYSGIPEEKKITFVLAQEYTGITQSSKVPVDIANMVMGLWTNGDNGTKPKGLATGTVSAPPGLTWVGERGPELVHFHGGERVYNSDRSYRIANTVSSVREDRGEAGASRFHSVPVGVTVQVQGGNGGPGIVGAIRENIPEIANQICRVVAVQLERQYHNTPSSGVAV